MKVLGSAVLGALLAAGLALCLKDRAPQHVAAAPSSDPAAICETLDPALERSFEAKYARIATADLPPLAKVLYDQLMVLNTAAVERRVADGEYEEFVYQGRAAAPSGVSVASGTLTVSGPPGAQIARHVVVPEGYDAELDLLRLEYAWLVVKCDEAGVPLEQ